MPELYKQYVDIAKKLEKGYKDVQDMEFTIEKGKLWILQTRNGKRTAKASVRIAVEMCEEGIIDKERAVELVDANQLYQVLLPDFDPKAKKEAQASIAGFASGGYPTRGDYFLANENGKPEYVGSIGNRTAVANQNQIVQGISYGVAMANSEQNALLRTQNDLLMRILSKGTDVYLNGRKVTDELSQVANARGTNPLSGGFSYV